MGGPCGAPSGAPVPTAGRPTCTVPSTLIGLREMGNKTPIVGVAMNTAQILPFRFESREIRTSLIDNEAWFAAQDILCSLDYAENYKPSRAMTHVPDQWKGVHRLNTLGGNQDLLMLSEQGLYFFLGRSDKPKALPFQMWLAGEVLPSIRKHGQYLDTTNKLGTLIGQTIGTDGFHILGNLVAGKVRKLPAKSQRSARMKIWSQLHTAYGVKSAEDIPAEYLDGARQFIAAYAIEGEYLPFQGGAPSVSQNHLSIERSVAYGLVTHAYQAAELLLEVEKGLRDFSSPLANQAISQAEGLRMFAGVIKGQNRAQFEAVRVQQERVRAALLRPAGLN